MSTRFVVPVAAASLFAVGCGSGSPPPPATPPVEGSPPAATPEPAAAVDAGPPPPTAAQRRPLELTSNCTTQTTIYVGEDPKAGGEGKKTVSATGGIPMIPRLADGTQTVWLLDEAGAPLIKVNITRGMKKIEIGKSCRTLDAH
jgi:hypothetical protein